MYFSPCEAAHFRDKTAMSSLLLCVAKESSNSLELKDFHRRRKPSVTAFRKNVPAAGKTGPHSRSAQVELRLFRRLPLMHLCSQSNGRSSKHALS
jgi:hypothetical protein